MNLTEAMQAIQQDCESDAKRTEGMLLTGRNVGELFGSTLAMVAAVARGVELLAQERAIANAFTPPDPFSRKA